MRRGKYDTRASELRRSSVVQGGLEVTQLRLEGIVTLSEDGGGISDLQGGWAQQPCMRHCVGTFLRRWG